MHIEFLECTYNAANEPGNPVALDKGPHNEHLIGMSQKVTVLFDGGCHLCSREIEHYQKLDTAGHLAFVDIDDPTFEPDKLGVTLAAVKRHMHVQRRDGTWAVGVDAFIAIWQELPRFAWAARWAANAPIRRILQVGYAGFAKVRPYLPRRLRKTCDATCKDAHDSRL